MVDVEGNLGLICAFFSLQIPRKFAKSKNNLDDFKYNALQISTFIFSIRITGRIAESSLSFTAVEVPSKHIYLQVNLV
jgi:hypothetical protein